MEEVAKGVPVISSELEAVDNNDGIESCGTELKESEFVSFGLKLESFSVKANGGCCCERLEVLDSL